MSALNRDEAARACKTESVILRGLASVGQSTVAQRLNIDESTVSRLKAERLHQLAELLAVLGLKVVPQHMQCYDPAHIEHLQYFARRGMDMPGEPPVLDWSED